MRVDSKTRKIVKQEEYRSNWQNPWSKWHQHVWTLFEKLTTWGLYSGPWEEKQAVFRSAGGNEKWSNDESVYWRQWCSKKDNQWTSTFRSYWGQCCSKIVHDLVNPVNNRESKDTLEGNLYIVIFWNMAIDRCGHTVAFKQIWKRCAHHQDWRWTKDVPEGHFHSIIFWNMASNRWGYMNKCNWMVKRCTPPRLIAEQCCTWRITSYYHLQHGYDFWTMLSHSCIWMNIGRMHSSRLTVGPSCFEARRRTSSHEYGR